MLLGNGTDHLSNVPLLPSHVTWEEANNWPLSYALVTGRGQRGKILRTVGEGYVTTPWEKQTHSLGHTRPSSAPSLLKRE